MNMLADADLPEADDEFSYREDPRFLFVDNLERNQVVSHDYAQGVKERLRHPLIPSGYNETRLAELVGKAKAASDEAARLLVEYRARHPLMPVTGMYAGVDRRFLARHRSPREPGLLPPDPVDHPSHYVDAVPGIECIDVTEHFSFLRGNAIKYLWRAGSKGDTLEDLRKAAWYIEREIKGLSS